MGDHVKEIEFVDNGTAQILYADDLHDVAVIGQNCFFTLVEIRKTSGGVWYKEPTFYFRIPCTAVGPAIAMTVLKAATAIVIPAATGALRQVAAMGVIH